jgi:serine/threonine-protein kinase
MVLEYLDGSDFSALLEQHGALPVTDAVDFVAQALEAIAQAHKAGIVHRDLKPANLFLARQHDGTHLVKVLDFGISKALNPEMPSGAHTSTKALLGTPSYMSPEQLRSSKSVDVRSDIWAIGVILYELLSGRPPFTADTLSEVFVAILERTPASLRAQRPEIPAELEQIVLRCLERDLALRFANVAELAVALAPFGSPHAFVSAERVCRSIPSVPAGPAARMSSSPPAVTAHNATRTAAPWTHATGGTPKKARPIGTIVVVAAAALILLIPVGIFGARALRSARANRPAPSASIAIEGNTATSAGASEAARALPVADPSVTAAPPVAAAAAVADDAGAPNIASPALATSASPAAPPHNKSSGPRSRGGSSPPAPHSTSTPSAAKPECTPNYVLDANGEKHFKPECFR